MCDSDAHTWQTYSHHATSEGVVCYQRCACGSWRVVLHPGGVLADDINGTKLGRRVRIRDVK